jgi:hypothetical protein
VVIYGGFADKMQAIYLGILVYRRPAKTQP